MTSLLDPSNPESSLDPLPGESFSTYSSRRDAQNAEQAHVDATQSAQAQAQSQQAQATATKALGAQGFATYPTTNGSLASIVDVPTGQPLKGDGSPGGVVYGTDGSPKRVSYSAPDTPKLTDAYAPEAGGGTATDEAGNTYKTAPGLPHQWTGTDPAAAAAKQAAADAKALKDQQAALDYSHTVESQYVSTMQNRAKGHADALKANTASLSTIPELADTDLDGDGIADSLEAKFKPEGDTYNATSGFFGSGSLTAASLKARDDLAQRKSQAQALLATRQQIQAQAAQTTAYQAAAQRRLDIVNSKREALGMQKMAAAGIPPEPDQAAIGNSALPQAPSASAENQGVQPLTDAPQPPPFAGAAQDAPSTAAADRSESRLANPSSPQTASDSAPGQPVPVGPAKAYTFDPATKAVQFDVRNPVASVLQAHKDGAIDDTSAQAALEAAQKVQSAQSDLEKAAGAHPELKAFAEGLSTGGAFLAGGAATAAAATPINAAIGGATAPVAWLTVPAAEALEFLGGGALAAYAKRKVESKLSEYSDAVKSFQAAAQLHPGYEAAGEIIPSLPMAASSVRNLGRLGALAAEDLGPTASAAQRYAAGATAVGKAVAPAAAGGAAQELIARPALAYGADAISDALGIQHDPTEAPTVSSVAQAAGLGALLAGHGLKFGDYSSDQVFDILGRGGAHIRANVPMGEAVPAEALAQHYGANPNVDSATLSNLALPLTPAENEVFFKAQARLKQLIVEGKIDPNQAYTGSATQGTRAGLPMDSASVDFRQTAAGENASAETPPTNQPLLPGGPPPASPDSSTSLSPQPAAPVSRSGGAPSSFPTTSGVSSTSPPSTPAPAAGQAQPAPTPDDELRQKVNDMQLALDRGGVAPEAREATQALLDHLRTTLAPQGVEAQSPSGQDQQSAAPSAPVPGDAPPVAAPANEVPAPSPASVAPEIGPSPDPDATPAQSQSPAAPLSPRAQRAQDIVNRLEAIQAKQPLTGVQPAWLSGARQVLEQERIRNPAPPEIVPPEQRFAPGDKLRLLGREYSIASDDGGPTVKVTGPTGQPGTVRRSLAMQQRIGPAVKLPTETVPFSLNPGTPVAHDNRPAIVRGADVGGEHAVIEYIDPVTGKSQGRARVLTDTLNAYHPDILTHAANEKRSAAARQKEEVQQPGPGRPAAPAGGGNGTTARADAPAVAQPPAAGPGTGAESVVAGRQPAARGNGRAAGAGEAPGGGASGTETAPEGSVAPTSPKGIKARRAIDELTAKQRAANGFLAPGDRTMLRAARENLDRELNRQVLGPNPRPTSPAGKEALSRILKNEAASNAGAQLDGDKHAAWAGDIKTLESDFTAQRRAIEAGGAPPAPSVADTPTRPARNTPPAAPISTRPPTGIIEPVAGPFKPYQKVTYQGRPAVVEHSSPDQTLIRVAAGPDPKTGVNLVAKRVTITDPSKLKLAPLAPAQAMQVAKGSIAEMRDVLRNLGVKSFKEGKTQAASGVEIGDDGVLTVDARKLAESLSDVRDAQAAHDIDGTPAGWFAQVLAEEGIHATQYAVARSKGLTLEQHIESSLPDEAMPEGWEDAGREAYNQWDALPNWQKKAEFVRMVIQGKWTGRITEALYKYVQGAIDFLRRTAGFEKTDPRFKAHVEEVENHVRGAVSSADAAKTPRTFKMPSAPTGAPDALDHIAENGGMVSPTQAQLKPTYSKYQGDYDGAPTLGGYYHHAVYGGKAMPDQMAQTLHDEYGVGDGSVDALWKAVGDAVDLRRKTAAQRKSQAVQEKQAAGFDKDAITADTAKGKTEINTSSLSVGDKIVVGDQTLKVTDIDPDTMDVTLEDHSKYGVQQVADGKALFVEKVEPGVGNDSLAASRPDTQTRDLFGGDKELFDAAPKSLAADAPVASREDRQTWQRLTAKISRGEALTVPEHQAYLAAEKALGQRFMVDMDKAVSGKPAAIPADSRAQVAAKGASYHEITGSNGTVAGPATFTLAAAKPLTAYHGTPHEVDRFSSEKIGTGEGAQVYGHGLYFAQAKETAESYRRALTNNHEAAKAEIAVDGKLVPTAWQDLLKAFPNADERDVVHTLQSNGGDLDDAARGSFTDKQKTARYRAAIEALRGRVSVLKPKSEGNTYTVHLDADDSELLDWDEPYDEQSPKVQTAVSAMFKEMDLPLTTDGVPIYLARNPDGQAIHATVSSSMLNSKGDIKGAQAASELLQKHGIVGIQYRDQLSRAPSFTVSLGGGMQATYTDRAAARKAAEAAKPRGGGEIKVSPGTRNYVMFDDSRIKITHRNGQPVAGSGALAAAKPARGLTLREVGNDFPHDAAAPKLLPITGSNDEVIHRAAMEFKKWPETIKAADGSTITLNNPERGSVAARIRHVLFDNEDGKLKPHKAAWMPAVPETLKNAAVRLVDPKNGNRIYVREYQDGTKHMVIVEPNGAVADQKTFIGSWITQFPYTSPGRQGDMKIDWVRPDEKGTGLQQPASGPTPAGSNEGTVSPRPAFRKEIIPKRPEGQGPGTLAAARPSTLQSVVGEPINSRRAAFSPEADSLNVPRDQMPQIAAEHRGAMANFLAARGMDVSAGDALPGSLKPSQADFTPAKVAKAGAIREAGDANPRRILVSSDNRVIDGHHQWLDRLKNTPGEPMPVLRIDAPARDILSQIHEFPSAGMEKAPDIEDAPVPLSDRARRAQGYITELEAKQARQALTPNQQGLLDSARKVVADERARTGDALAAARPDWRDQPIDPDAMIPDSEPDVKRGSLLQRARDEIARARQGGELADTLSAHHDAVDTMANVEARHARSSVELDFDGPDKKAAALDRQAAGPVFEAGGRRAQLADDLARVKESPDKKLAAKFAPIYERALANLDRLHTANEGARNLQLAQDAAKERAGLAPQWQARTRHIYEDPASPESTILPDNGFGATKGYQTAADAIAAGVDPKTTDIADLMAHHVYRSQRAINEKAYRDRLGELKASDGKPLLDSIQENSSVMKPDGTVSSSARVPKGYEAVQAGDNVLVAHKTVAPLLKALYGDSAIANHWLGGKALDYAAIIKHGAIGIDTYHGAQVVLRSLLGFGTTGWSKGAAGLDFSDADLDRAVKAGRITQKDADTTRESRRVDRGLLAEGLNVGKASDNLLEAAKQANLIEKIPALGHAAKSVADFTFHRLQPAYMMQAGRVAYAKLKKQYPGKSDGELFRRAAKQINEFYGSLGTQGLLKSKTMQDAARLLFFAPSFAEGRFRTEARGAGQAARTFVDGVRGKGWRMGVTAQAMGGIILAGLVGSQIVNMISRGKPTWQNPEEGHRWDAWIPGGAHGFFFSPLSLAAEYSHQLYKYIEGGQSPLDALAHIASNKLSGGARAAKDLLTGKNDQGQSFGSTAERLKAAALDAAPLPMAAGALLKKDPKSPVGLSLNNQAGSVEKQALAMAGLKVDAAPSPRAQMYALAEPFRVKHGGDHPPGQYSDLRHALDAQDRGGAQDEIRSLLKDGKTLAQIGQALGLTKDGATVKPELFTGSPTGEREFYSKLSAPQKQIYLQAQRDRGTSVRFFRQYAQQLMAADPKARQLVDANARRARPPATP